MQQRVLFQAGDVQSRLAELGLDADALAQVIKRGYVAFTLCTPNDPPLYPGFAAWAQTVRALREYLVPEGWDRCDENNYSLVINPAGTMAIAVATGDDGTGRLEAMPTTKSSKGPSTAEAVIANQAQLTFDFYVPETAAPADGDVARDERITWMLLVHRGVGEVRSELSLPMSMGADGRIESWQERIILGSMPTDPTEIDINPPSPVMPDIQIDVKRRA
ncbi:hypothetical protein [Roseateles sp.]|uniref:hypothetical protein n=1 Tax=Roseateles sp. TaxID=1971397 RepID=UPI0039EA84BA